MKEMLNFYLTNHDFEVFVNKGIQAYSKTRDEMLQDAAVRKVYKEMQEGGCNAGQKQREDHGCSSETDTVATCCS